VYLWFQKVLNRSINGYFQLEDVCFLVSAKTVGFNAIPYGRELKSYNVILPGAKLHNRHNRPIKSKF
jgi:hypothetical protein